MANLNLHREQPAERLAAALRRAFSGIVAGNVKEYSIQAIEQYGPYQLHGDAEIMRHMDTLLQGFVARQRLPSVLRNPYLTQPMPAGSRHQHLTPPAGPLARPMDNQDSTPCRYIC